MPAPFSNAIKGTTAGTPGTGAFTPNAASSGFRAWSLVSAGWVGLVRYEDGSSWELCYSYWNGTTLSRASSQIYDSSSGSAISLTSAATAAMVADAGEIMPDLGSAQWRGWIPGLGNTAWVNLGMSAVPATTGTLAGGAISATSYLTEQARIQNTSATTANAQAVMYGNTTGVAIISTSAGRGGFECVGRFGATVLPTGPRLFVGVTSVTFVANTGEPSALQSANVAVFAKDSADTNIQLLTNDGTASNGTKIDTGIPWVANGWYEVGIWCEPGSNKVYALLVRLDTGAVWYGSTTTDVPATGALVFPQMMGGLSSTTGTAIVFQGGSMFMRTGQ